MAVFEYLVMGRTDPRLRLTAEGDVVTFRRSPFLWGKGELHSFLIVPIKFDKEDEASLEEQFYGGETQEDVEKRKRARRILTDSGMQDLPKLNTGTLLSKSRYQLPLEIIKDWYPSLDLNRVRDESEVYQPFLKNDIVINSSEKFSLFRDKYLDSFRYSERRTV